MRGRKKSRLQIAQDKAQAAINKTNEAINELGVHTGELYQALTDIQSIFDGWKAVNQFFNPKEKKNDDKEPKVLPPLEKGMTIPILSGEIKEGKTQAPKRFTEDVILSRMETAGADEMPDEVERKGLGTPATRAGIIEKLVQKGFLERKGDKKTK